MTNEPAIASQDVIMRAVAAFFLALSFFVLGCLVVENDVNYPAWRTLPPPEFMRHHAAIETGLQWTMFPAMGVHLLLGIALLVRPWPASRGSYRGGVRRNFDRVVRVGCAAAYGSRCERHAGKRRGDHQPSPAIPLAS